MKKQLSTSRQTDSELPSALRNFDHLPATAYVRQPIVEALLSCSAATVWRRVADGGLPRPHKLSPRVTAWNVGELRRILSTFKGNHRGD